MPVQPQYSIGPLAQPAPPDGNQIPSQDGNARFVRSSPPGMFVAQSPESCQRSVDITLLNSQVSQLHRTPTNLTGLGAFSSRRTSDGFAFGDVGNSPHSARQEHLQVSTSPGFDTLHQGTMPQEAPMRYSTLCAQNPANLLGLNSNSQPRSGFHVVKEDFPALPRIPELEFPDESFREETSQRSPPTSQAEPESLAGVPGRDRFDLLSFAHRWSSEEHIEAYHILNFDDIFRRMANLHPLGQCTMENSSRELHLQNLVIGVNIANQCTQFHEPEDLRTEDSSFRIVNGCKVPMPENDKYYAMSDVLKDKLRTPRLQMMDDLTLFFQFYCFTRDTQQLVAADALFQRNWRWNKKISRWCRFERAQHQGALQVGVFQVYDPVGCRIQSTLLQYSSLDFELSPPVIPPPTSRTHNYAETL